MLQPEAIAETSAPTTATPVVSVVIPAYNVAPYISETLDSIFAQTFADYEVIVVNDGSPDTKELERALDAYLGRIVYLRQENRGAGAARNAGLKTRARRLRRLSGRGRFMAAGLSERTARIYPGRAITIWFTRTLCSSGNRPFRAAPLCRSRLQTARSHSRV